MQKSSRKCLPESKDFMTFKGPKHSQFNPRFEVKNQPVPAGPDPVRLHHSLAQGK